MKNVIDLIKRQKQLDADSKTALIKLIKENQEFITNSRKFQIVCSCGMNQEIWTTSAFLAYEAYKAYNASHTACMRTGSGPEIHFKVI